ncbi:MAG: hypothetical protein JW750_07835 [Anaerolineaceae bacterium]|nr:hypothetical protein [Anaerolineaceae bacterium]
MKLNRSALRKGVNTGITFGVILLFLSLIAFTVVLATIIEDARRPSVFVYALVLIILGMFSGMSASGKHEEHKETNWPDALTACVTAGLIQGVIMGVFALIIGIFHSKGVDMREYMVKLSPEVADLYLFNGSSTIAFILYVVVMVVGNLLGGALEKGVIRTDWRADLQKKLGEKFTERVESPKIQQLLHGRFSKTIFIGIGLLLLVGLPFVWGGYWNYVMGTVGIYIILGLGMNIIVGLSGQLVLGYVSFFAIGAYTMGLLTSIEPLGIQMGFWPALGVSLLTAALTGLLLGLPILNLRGDYLAIVTLGFGEIIRILLKSDTLTGFTGGPKGVRNIAQPTLFGMRFSSDVNYMHLILIGVAIGLFIAYRLQYSRVGRAWLSVNGDETVSRATGVNTFYYKLLALGIGAAFAGIGGALFAARNQFTGPEDHIMMVSINVLCLVIVGGMGSLPGVILGSFVLKGIPELLRDLTDYRLLVFGLLLVVMMILRPGGLWPVDRPKLEKGYLSRRKLPTDQDDSTEEVTA